MGGSAGRGNFTPNAEFNIAIDPEAARVSLQRAGDCDVRSGCD
jgi:inosine-uridine nucleoside N-ribohydrolase